MLRIKIFQTMRLLSSTLLASTLLSGCASTLDKLEQVGSHPPVAAVDNPAESPTYKHLNWPMPETLPPAHQYANSLWQPGSRAFFRDQRAARVGDIVRVNISVNDKAQVDNETERKRTAVDVANAPTVFGLERKISHVLSKDGVAATLLNTNSNTDTKGTGTVKRTDVINTQIAALITQLLPNGNLVIDGSQEMLINFEVRRVSIKGVVRPQDIRSDNSIDSNKIAEARIEYGGHGQLTDVQQPRWGSQVLDAIAPF